LGIRGRGSPWSCQGWNPSAGEYGGVHGGCIEGIPVWGWGREWNGGLWAETGKGNNL